MVVCICNALTEKDILDAKEDGVDRIAGIFRYYEVRPRCGVCALPIRDILDKNPQETSNSDT